MPTSVSNVIRSLRWNVATRSPLALGPESTADLMLARNFTGDSTIAFQWVHGSSFPQGSGVVWFYLAIVRVEMGAKSLSHVHLEPQRCRFQIATKLVDDFRGTSTQRTGSAVTRADPIRVARTRVLMEIRS